MCEIYTVSVNLCFNICVCYMYFKQFSFLPLYMNYTLYLQLILLIVKLWSWNRFHDVTAYHFSVKSFRKRARKILFPFCYWFFFFYLSFTKWKRFAFCFYTIIEFLFKPLNRKQFVSPKFTFLRLPNPSLNYVFFVDGFSVFSCTSLHRYLCKLK